MTDSPESERLAPEVVSETRPMYWSVRRELWENRSIYLAPLAVAAFVVFGMMISTIGMPARRRAVLMLDPAQQRAKIGQPYDLAAVILIGIAFVVAAFYCLDALHGERRDRSILFWKSLPVSDRTTVLSKASIPLVVLPLITFAIIVTTQFLMLLWSSVVLLPSGLAGTTDTLQFVAAVADTALRADRAGALACAHLCVAAAGLRLGTTGDVSMGRGPVSRDRRFREGRVQHLAFRLVPEIPFDRLVYAGFRPGARRRAD